MKKSLSIFPVVLILLLSPAGIVSGQGKTDFNVKRQIELNGEKDIQEIFLPVSENNSLLSLKITSVIHEGDLTIEVYDPEGERQGNFSIGCQYNSKTSRGAGGSKSSPETVNGQILRTFNNPISGDWIVRIIPNNPVGSLQIESSQKYRENYQSRSGFFQTPFEPIQSLIDSIQSSINENHPYKVTSTFTGTIMDTNNKPLRGASVQVKGINIGTVSDRNGNFTLMAPTFLARTLRFSYPGKKTQEVVVGEHTKFIITLMPE